MRLVFLLVVFVALAGFSHASNFTITNSTCNGGGDLLATMTNLPGCIVESFFSTLTSGFAYTIDQLLTTSFNFIAAAPDLHWFCTPYNNVMAIIESLYTLAFMGLGLFYIFRSTDVEGRLAAKEWLKNIFFMILALSFSFQIFGIMISVNSYLTTSFLSYATQDVFNPSTAFGSLIFAFIILMTAVFVLLLAFLTLLARYLLISFLLLLFPISIFLYFIPFTKEWGSTFMRLIVSVVFMTSLDALLVMALSLLFSTPDPNLASSFVRGIAIILGFSLIGVLNAFLFLTSLFSLLGTATKALGPIRYLIAGVIGKVIL